VHQARVGEIKSERLIAIGDCFDAREVLIVEQQELVDTVLDGFEQLVVEPRILAV